MRHTGPKYSVVAAVYNVDRYLGDFIASLEAQSFDFERLEIVMVDDGSTDSSLATLEAWAARRPDNVAVVTQQNRGQGPARNLGLEHASGEWVTFIDPDDTIDVDYFAAVDRFIVSHGDLDMVATNRVFLEDESGEIDDSHPLRWMFAGGDRVVDLVDDPTHFHGGASSAFLKRAAVVGSGVRFDARVRPNFEDGHFCCRFLLDRGSARVGFVGSARYHYRRRSDGSSTTQTALDDPDRFVSAPRFGYLDVLRRGSELNGGSAPRWLQNFVLYELSFYFAHEKQLTATPTAAVGRVAGEFIAHLAEIATFLDPDVIEAFDARSFDSAWRDILTHGFTTEGWIAPYAAVVRRDSERGEMLVGYRFVGTRPEESIDVGGVRVEPMHQKVWAHRYWDHDLLYERLAWVPTGHLSVTVDGHSLPVREGWPRAGGSEPTWVTPVSTAARVIERVARSLPVRRRFRDAWVLLDRRHAGDDNAERLFRYLRDVHPEINAWFTIEKGTADWERLRRDGYGARLVPYGTIAWRLLLLNAQHVISSQIDNPSVAPWEITRYGPVPWHTTFLQHGVIKDDLSRWLNRKAIDLFVTSTPAEHQSIVGDYTPYPFTTREVRMLGLARFDRLRDLGSQYDVGDRDVILVCPTWRHWLAPTKNRSGHVLVDGLLESDWVRNWVDFLRDRRLRTVASRASAEIVFLPHPILQAALPELHLPPYVRALRSEGHDLQALMARSVAFVTDYSSMAFNAAYIDRPVVYFQFDKERVERGAHTGRVGYFDYERDGFGRVTQSPDEAIEALVGIVEDRDSFGEEYRRRIEAAFPQRDGRCCARTVQAVMELGAPGDLTRS